MSLKCIQIYFWQGQTRLYIYIWVKPAAGLK